MAGHERSGGCFASIEFLLYTIVVSPPSYLKSDIIYLNDLSSQLSIVGLNLAGSVIATS